MKSAPPKNVTKKDKNNGKEHSNGKERSSSNSRAEVEENEEEKEQEREEARRVEAAGRLKAAQYNFEDDEDEEDSLDGMVEGSAEAQRKQLIKQKGQVPICFFSSDSASTFYELALTSSFKVFCISYPVLEAFCLSVRVFSQSVSTVLTRSLSICSKI